MKMERNIQRYLKNFLKNEYCKNFLNCALFVYYSWHFREIFTGETFLNFEEWIMQQILMLAQQNRMIP